MKRMIVIMLALCLCAGPLFAQDKSEPIKIGAIFAVTGPASFLGAPQEKTAKMLVDKINAEGGVNGQQVELIIKDSAGSSEKAVSFAKQLIEEDKVLAIIGPSTSGESLAITQLCDDNQMILISCAAAEKITKPVLKYVMKTAPNDSDAVTMIYRTMKDKGITKIAVLSSNDGFGNAGKAQLEARAEAEGITILINEVYDKQATDLTDILTKVKSTEGVQAVVNWSIVPAQSIVSKNMVQLSFDVPLFQSHGFANPKYVEQAGTTAEGTLFPASRIVVADQLPDDNPQKAMLLEYKNAYESEFKENVSTFGGHPYDAINILVAAIKKAGSAEAAKVRDALENVKDFPGTAGVFNLSADDHCGLDVNAFEMLTVKDGKFAIYKK
mgnify:CR=1 FL=1